MFDEIMNILDLALRSTYIAVKGTYLVRTVVRNMAIWKERELDITGY